VVAMAVAVGRTSQAVVTAVAATPRVAAAAGRTASTNRGSRRRPRHGNHLAHHGHHHWIFRNGVWMDDFGDDADNTPGYVAPAAAAAPGPCTCLTKTYTTAGLVVFADVCTKEAASARVDGTASNDTQTPAVQDKSSNAPPPAAGRGEILQSAAGSAGRW
jgi:hypothetical protein